MDAALELGAVRQPQPHLCQNQGCARLLARSIAYTKLTDHKTGAKYIVAQTRLVQLYKKSGGASDGEHTGASRTTRACADTFADSEKGGQAQVGGMKKTKSGDKAKAKSAALAA